MKLLSIAGACLLGLALSGAGSTGLAGEEAPLKVFVFAGQSNMVGRGAKKDQLPKEMQGELAGAQVYTGGKWVKLAPGVTEKQGFGPEISCAHALVAGLGGEIGIVKHSVGGTSLGGDWDPEKPKGLYSQLAAKVGEARKSRPVKIVGMFWMQGERDSRDAKMAGAYAANLAAFVARCRKDFESPDMFFVLGRVNPPKGGYAQVDVVRKAQAECPAARYAWVDCDGLSKLGDNLHYDTAGLVKMGQLFAESALKLLAGPAKAKK